LAFVAYMAFNPPEPVKEQSEYERRCRYLGHNDPTKLKDCIWAHRAQEMAKWRQVDWERWKAISGASDADVLRQRAAVWLEIERQNKSGNYKPN
jgi:broad specificity phosphatase PhoE